MSYEYVPIPTDDLVNKVGLVGFRVQGDSMASRNIHNGDIVIIDPAVKQQKGDLVIVAINDEFNIIEFSDNKPDCKIYGKVIKIMTLRDA